jgi:hypothetical protein
MADKPTSDCNPGREPEPVEFYVGYLPAPTGYTRFLRRIVPILFLAIAVGGGLAIWSHNNPGSGTWDADSVQQFEGVIDTLPYAMLRVAGPDSSRPIQTILLVSEGKFGARERADPFRGRAVRVRGTVLSRDGRRLLELADGGAAIESIESSEASFVQRLGRPMSERIGVVTLRGEIIDPKCYFGAMKPGEGKTHKDCATLCISGGIPPMFLTRSPDGTERYYLLADTDGKPVSDQILPFVADPVEIAGAVERLGDLLVFKIDAATIRRL